MKTFFTSDHHFGHENIIKFANRPFKNTDEMDEAMIARWNEVVGERDAVYYIGDFSLRDIGFVKQTLIKLNGNIMLVPGSHDKWLNNASNHLLTKTGVFKVLPPIYSLYGYVKNQAGFGLPIVLCHYSMRSWDASHYGSWHLFGHHHGGLKSYGMSFDIGVDVWDYAPVEFEKVKEAMSLLKPIEDYSNGKHNQSR